MRKKEVRIPNVPNVYRVVEVHEDGKEVLTQFYRVRFRVKVDGKWSSRTQTFDNLGDAKVFARAGDTGDHIAPNSKHQFEDVFDRYLKYLLNVKRVRSATIALHDVRRKHLDFFKGMVMEQLNSKAIDAWLNLMYDPEYLETQHSSRINYEKEFSILSGFFRYYRNHEDEKFISPLLDRHRERAHARSKDQVTEIKYLDEAEEVTFLEVLNDHDPYRDLALFQLHSGCRVSEAAALEFKNINFTKREVVIRQHLYWERKRNGVINLVPGTKSGPNRVVPLSDDCLGMLKRRQQLLKSGKVFPWNRDGGWLPYRCVQAIYNKAFKKANIDKSSTHVLRHTFAVRFLDQTKDIYALQKVLGHTSLDVTQVYAKYSNDSVRRAFQLFKGGKAVQEEGLVSPLVSPLVSRKQK